MMITDNDWYQHEYDTVYLDYILGRHDIKTFYNKNKQEVIPGVPKGEGQRTFKHSHCWEITNFPLVSQRPRLAKVQVRDHTNDVFLNKEFLEMFTVYIRVIPDLFHVDDGPRREEIIQFEISARKYSSPAPLHLELVVLNSEYEPIRLRKRYSFEQEKIAGTALSKVKDVRWVYREELMQHLKGRTHVTILGHITQTVTYDSEKVFMSKPEDNTYRLEVEMANHMTELFNSGKHSDFTLIVPRGRFRVHKFILMLHSKYFEALFRSKMIETRKRITYLNTDFESMMEIVTFMYSMASPNIFWKLCDIHITSKYFRIDALTALTEEEIPRAMNVLNVLSYFVMCNRVGFEKFMPLCKEIISRRKKRIVKTTQYKVMIERYVDVIANFYDIPDLDGVKVFCWEKSGWTSSSTCSCSLKFGAQSI